MIEVYKFGGISVKDADNIKNVCNIIKQNNNKLIVVISAIDKTTNALEVLTQAYFEGNKKLIDYQYNKIIKFHLSIINELFNNDNDVIKIFENIFNSLKEKLISAPGLNYDFEYDQIVSFGEIISTKIISLYANANNINNKWLDARKLVKTDSCYRHASLNKELTFKYINSQINFEDTNIYITQGFIGSNENNLTTTLGREGSDYSGAIFASCVKANSLTVWKDVVGIMNADPRKYNFSSKIDELSYVEAIELAYYGAQVIHPNTMKPLYENGIKLFVRSFKDTNIHGTIIQSKESKAGNIPIFIIQDKQIFITISTPDYSFILDNNISELFALFNKYKVKINLMQNSALNFSICINKNRNINKLIEELKSNYSVLYNDNVHLFTIKNYTNETLKKIDNKKVVDSQLSRKTARFVLKD